MPRKCFPALLFLAHISLAGSVTLLNSLPPGATSTAIALDQNGNIYAAGFVTPAAPKSAYDTEDAFVAKLSPDGSTLAYFTEFGGSNLDQATSLAVAADGSIYVTGNTQSQDFPITSGSLGIAQPPSGSGSIFVAKLNAAGTVIAASLLGGFGGPPSITFDLTGNLIITSSQAFAFPATSGALSSGPGGALLKLDPTLTNVLLSIQGYGGGPVALDAQGNIYIAGVADGLPEPGFGLPTLPGNGFQTTHTTQFCSTTSGPSGFAIACEYQYVAKIDPTGANLLWSTYITGTYGAVPRAISVDSSGEVTVAGSTNSDDYPVTPGAFQTAYTAVAPLIPITAFPYTTAPPATGYVTKLNSTGTALVWSTYFGGSRSDSIRGMTIDAMGNIYVSGIAGSPDLPGLSETPPGCRSSAVQTLPFVARLSADGATASATQLVYGAPVCLYVSCQPNANAFPGWQLALRGDGSLVTAGSNGIVAIVDPAVQPRLDCFIDAADAGQLSSLTPGQVIAVFGTDLVSEPDSAQPTTLTASIGGVSAPILYTSPNQANLQVPFEIAGQPTVQVEVTGGSAEARFTETRTFGVAPIQPTVLLSSDAIDSTIAGYTLCGSAEVEFPSALALNADGAVNDCSNPAAAGSIVTIFVSGLGVTTPAQTTGATQAAPAAPVSPSVDQNVTTEAAAIATTTVPGTLSGILQVQLQLPQSSTNDTYARISVGGVPAREPVVIVWTK